MNSWRVYEVRQTIKICQHVQNVIGDPASQFRLKFVFELVCRKILCFHILFYAVICLSELSLHAYPQFDKTAECFREWPVKDLTCSHHISRINLNQNQKKYHAKSDNNIFPEQYYLNFKTIRPCLINSLRPSDAYMRQ